MSIDGLPGMKRGHAFAQQNGVKPLRKMVGRAGEKVDKGGIGERERITVVHLLIVLFLGIVIGGALSLSVVTPERVAALKAHGLQF